MIDHWLSEDGRKAIEKMGWPEVDILLPPHQRAKMFPPAQYEHAHRGYGAFRLVHGSACQFLGPSHALALLRDHAREWLETQYRDVRYNSINRDGLRWHGIFISGVYRDLDYGEQDYDAALIAAILATEADQ